MTTAFSRFYGAFPDFEAEGQPVAVWATSDLSMASIKKAAKGLVAKYKAALDVAYIRSGHYPISAKDALYERERGLQDVVRLQMSRDAELSPFLCEQAFECCSRELLSRSSQSDLSQASERKETRNLYFREGMLG